MSKETLKNKIEVLLDKFPDKSLRQIHDLSKKFKSEVVSDGLTEGELKACLKGIEDAEKGDLITLDELLKPYKDKFGRKHK